MLAQGFCPVAVLLADTLLLRPWEKITIHRQCAGSRAPSSSYTTTVIVQPAFATTNEMNGIEVRCVLAEHSWTPDVRDCERHERVGATEATAAAAALEI